MTPPRASHARVRRRARPTTHTQVDTHALRMRVLHVYTQTIDAHWKRSREHSDGTGEARRGAPSKWDTGTHANTGDKRTMTQRRAAVRERAGTPHTHLCVEADPRAHTRASMHQGSKRRTREGVGDAAEGRARHSRARDSRAHTCVGCVRARGNGAPRQGDTQIQAVVEGETQEGRRVITSCWGSQQRRWPTSSGGAATRETSKTSTADARPTTGRASDRGSSGPSAADDALGTRGEER